MFVSTLEQIREIADNRFADTNLSELQRYIFVARWYFEMNHNEIGKVLGKTSSHVRVEIGRISAKMDEDPGVEMLI